jgi:hypothetical protein
MEPASLLEDSPTSMWMIRAAELFPKANCEKDDSQLQIPFTECKDFIFISDITKHFFFFFSAW